MSDLKVGDKVFIGPFEILQFRDTHRPGPQDTGDSIIVTRGDHGALSADTSLTIPAVPNLAAVARVLAAHPGIGEAVQAISDLLICERSDIPWPNGVELKIGHPDWQGIVLEAAKELNAKRRAVTPEVVEQFRQFAAALNGDGE